MDGCQEVASERTFRCARCPRLFLSGSRMRKHVLTQHGMSLTDCFHCGYSTNDGGQLDEHVRSHFTDKQLFCDFCAARFVRLRNLLEHVNEHLHNQRKFMCAQCQKTFISKLSLTTHLRIHSGERPYGCSFCPKTFTQLASQRYHEKIHTGVCSHFCSFCRAGFKSKISRDSHERAHTGERPFQCNYCEATFRSLMTLKQHHSVHADNNSSFKCDICSRGFKRREKLRIHMRAHLGAAPYVCRICDKQFNQNYDLSRHTRFLH